MSSIARNSDRSVSSLEGGRFGAFPLITHSSYFLRRAGHEAELDVTEIRDDIPNHEEPIVLHVDLQVVAEVGTLSKENKMGQTEGTRYNLVGVLLVNRHL